MVKRPAAVLAVALIWGVVAVASVATAARVGELWQNTAAYLLVAILVLTAWLSSELMLGRAGVGSPREDAQAKAAFQNQQRGDSSGA